MVKPRAVRMDQLPKQFFANLVQAVNRRVQAGRDVINLGQGNPDLPTPDHVVEALREAALNPETHRYPPFTGLPSLKAAVAAFYEREYGVSLDPRTEVAVLFGGKTGLVEISQIYLNEGDIALVPDPGYPDYWSGIALAGARMETMPLLPERGFLPDFSAIPHTVADQAKLMFLNYPNNPTGATASEDFYQAAVDFAASHDVLVVHDFAYGAIGFDGRKPPSFLQTPGAKSVGIELYTLSKTYNMAGWRIAFAVGEPSVIANINLLQDHYYVSIFAAIQEAARVALISDQTCVRQLVATYEARRNAFVQALQAGGVECPLPGGSFFVWMPVPGGLDSVTFADYLLREADVAVAPGVGFGQHGEGFVRVAMLAEENRLHEAAERITQAVRRMI
ncbi:MAG: pyridoxal phosphate-dependent aminotransferase [Alicyclobacillus sp.]|nr:pyridoxal phosphate-dependent aminotransferase [Alicyclobacillus sp.]